MKKEKKLNQFLKSGKRYFKDQKYDKALVNFLEAYEMDKENPDTLYFLGITYTRIGKYESAIYNFEQILKLEFTYINTIHTEMIMGYIYTILEDYEKALSLFNGILKARLESAQVFAAIGYIMDRLGNFKEACMNLYRAIDIEPKNANAHNSLGYIFAEKGINLEEALSECKKAVSLDKTNPAYLDSLGWVYFKLEKMTQAKSYLKKALKMAPANKEIKNHLKVVMDSIR